MAFRFPIIFTTRAIKSFFGSQSLKERKQTRTCTVSRISSKISQKLPLSPTYSAGHETVLRSVSTNLDFRSH